MNAAGGPYGAMWLVGGGDCGTDGGDGERSRCNGARRNLVEVKRRERRERESRRDER